MTAPDALDCLCREHDQGVYPGCPLHGRRRDALAALVEEVLRAHHDIRELHPGGIKTYHCEKCCGQSYCLSHTRGEFAAHQTAAVLAAITAEHAIVKLPEPEVWQRTGARYWRAGDTTVTVEKDGGASVYVCDDWFSDDHAIDPATSDELRALAAALLAATRAEETR